MNIQILWISFGGFLGTFLRLLVASCWPSLAIPFINLSGSFLIGFLAVVLQMITASSTWTAFWLSGFLGGFTTFSAFSSANAQYLKNGYSVALLLNILIQVGCGIALVFAGERLANLLFGSR